MADDNKPTPPPKDDNLIPFPVERIKKRRVVKALAGKLPNKKVTLFVSVAAILIMAVFANQYQFKDARFVANEDGFVRDIEAEKQLALELSNPENRGPASFGREPSAEDNMRSGELQSRYQLVFESGKVVAIHLNPGTGISNEPIYLRDRQAFLERYKTVIAPGYETVEQVADPEHSDLTREVFVLKRGPASVGRAHFELDRSGAFHSLKVEVVQPAETTK